MKTKPNFTLELAADRIKALELTPVSHETLMRLDRFVELLIHWQNSINLVAPSTLPKLWTRHIADSLQLLMLIETPILWVDLGSGGGFPGMIIACSLAEHAGAEVHLVESNQKKAAFLREAARVTGAPAKVHAMRIEDFADDFSGRPDVVSARALAPLADLLELAYPLLKTGAVGLFPKGQDVGAELTQASKYWKFEHDLVPSLTNPDGQIVVVRKLAQIS
ncbi:MAG: 16S rRNA (guanine(527)-N(7))-methyltransferase RsmG [Pseudorhodoplanes sp.]|jgi:16S rRNA (guanine527-N7)-methyltransferase|nr:16S rRNA (guanine(527)-N(7))-methyltransferase RsmG [Pseudorhodoplanes sp.]